MKLWTVTSSYRVPEGQIITGFVTYAGDANDATDRYIAKFGELINCQLCDVNEGVDFSDPILLGLFNIDLLTRFAEVQDTATDLQLHGSALINLA